MATSDLLLRRLHGQRLAPLVATPPSEIVHWLGAVQAQDYDGAKWAIGQRGIGLTNAMIEHACDTGAILRTHVLRPTWHFVSPVDIRWMLMLTGPRVHSVNAYYYRQAGLDEATFERSNALLQQTLAGGSYKTRAELRATLERSGISCSGLRFTHLLMYAELEALICSGPRCGKQWTYGLVAERAPHAIMLTREEALAELVRRYFQSHGPAQVQDFVWWSGLTAADARAGLDALGGAFMSETIDGKTYWGSSVAPSAPVDKVMAYLLPNYDEYLGSYRDRSLAVDAHEPALANRECPHLLVVNGRLAGLWRRTIKTSSVAVMVQPFRAFSATEQHAIDGAAERYGAFLERPVTITYAARS